MLFTGDGAFGLTAMEVATAVRHELPIVVIVSNNAGWGDVRYEQDKLSGLIVTSPARSRVSGTTASPKHSVGTASVWSASRSCARRSERSLASGTCSVVDVQTDPAVISELLRMVAQLGLM